MNYYGLSHKEPNCKFLPQSPAMSTLPKVQAVYRSPVSILHSYVSTNNIIMLKTGLYF